LYIILIFVKAQLATINAIQRWWRTPVYNGVKISNKTIRLQGCVEHNCSCWW